MQTRASRAALCSALLVGCATTTTNTTTTGQTQSNSGGSSQAFGVVPLPDRGRLQALAARPATVRGGARESSNVSEWRLTGPLPTAIEAANVAQPLSTTDAFERLVQTTAPSATTTEALRCVAREAATFEARGAGNASAQLLRYFSLACGLSMAPQVWFLSFDNVGASMTTDALLAEQQQALSTQIRPVLSGATGGVGAALVREGARVKIAIARGQSLVRFTTVSMEGAAESVVRGEISGANAGDAVAVIANTRDGGARFCVAEAGMVAPRFGFRCPAASDGAPEYADVMYVPRGRLLGRLVGTVLIGGAADGRLAFRRATTAAISFTDEATSTAALEALLNERRRASGIAALQFSESSRRAACPVAGYAVGALTGDVSSEDAEVAVLGMMAGWGVEGRVREGHAGANVLVTGDGSQLVTTTLDQPSGRMSLLDPEAAHGALCPIVVDRKFIGMAYATWRVVDERSMHDVAGVWARVDEERRRLGHEPVQRWTGATRSLEAAIDALDRGTTTPDTVSQRLSNAAVEEGSTGVRVMMFSMVTPSGAPMQVPSELLDRRLTRAQIGTTWFRAPGSAWAVRVVLVVVPQEGVNLV
ncbi:MAG: hypothetical protein JNK05_40545 [Myxococcales bacterium]|nr:hypothetical protein [Myxococcales bacterium]